VLALAELERRSPPLPKERIIAARKAEIARRNQAAATRRAARVLPIVRQLQAAGLKTPRAIADALNERAVPTLYDRGTWHSRAVINLLMRPPE
jgi:hypothetical protein